mgnify:CR=1 FL=1
MPAISRRERPLANEIRSDGSTSRDERARDVVEDVEESESLSLSSSSVLESEDESSELSPNKERRRDITCGPLLESESELSESESESESWLRSDSRVPEVRRKRCARRRALRRAATYSSSPRYTSPGS